MAARAEGVPLDPPLLIARRARADLRRSWSACRGALLGLRNQGFRARLLEEDEPLFLAVELEKDGAHLLATAELLPEGEGSELEIRLEGSAPRTGLATLTGAPERAVAALERRVLSGLKRELGRALTGEASDVHQRLRSALEATRADAARRREKRAEVESAFAAGLIDGKERAHLLARLG